jgi:uncharacterized membrane protein YhaH (DUF805 family)
LRRGFTAHNKGWGNGEGERSAMLDLMYLFLSFEGRISRQSFWIGVGILAVVETLAQYASTRMGGDRLGVVADLVFAFPEFALAAKRAHDRNISTWVIALFFAGAVALDLLTLGGWDAIAEKPTDAFLAILIPWGVFALILLVDLGFRRGTQGPNPYGPDPLAE